MLRRFKYNKTKCISIMRSVAKKNGLKFNILKWNEGFGGYNYGASAGNSIYVAPFVKSDGNSKMHGMTVSKPCTNPTECMLATFFHEFAHCKLVGKVPGVENKGRRHYAWNRTSKLQFELWLTMLGFDYARKMGIVFSDETVIWMLKENFTYARPDETGKYNIVSKKVTDSSYELVQDDFLYNEEK